MGDRTDITPDHLQRLLMIGKLRHEFDFFGEKCVLDLFPAGTVEDVMLRAAGPDEETRKYRRDVLSIAHALRSLGGYDFEDAFDQRLKFVQALYEPVQDLLIAEYYNAKLRQTQKVKELLEALKKASPDQG